jgi:hypothetical protein
VGDGVGDGVGDAVGADVGDVVGYGVGVRVCEGVGAGVGEGVGAGVGVAVAKVVSFAHARLTPQPTLPQQPTSWKSTFACPQSPLASTHQSYMLSRAALSPAVA